MSTSQIKELLGDKEMQIQLLYQDIARLEAEIVRLKAVKEKKPKKS